MVVFYNVPCILTASIKYKCRKPLIKEDVNGALRVLGQNMNATSAGAFRLDMNGKSLIVLKLRLKLFHHTSAP